MKLLSSHSNDWCPPSPFDDDKWPKKSEHKVHTNGKTVTLRFVTVSRDSINLHDRLPHTLTAWFHLIFNGSILLLLTRSVWWLANTIPKDIERQRTEFQENWLRESFTCYEKYTANQCSSTLISSEVRQLCDQWKSCFEKEPPIHFSSHASVTVIAGAMNTFFDNLTTRTLISVLVVFVVVLITVNVSLRLSRGR